MGWSNWGAITCAFGPLRQLPVAAFEDRDAGGAPTLLQPRAHRHGLLQRPELFLRVPEPQTLFRIHRSKDRLRLPQTGIVDDPSYFWPRASAILRCPTASSILTSCRVPARDSCSRGRRGRNQHFGCEFLYRAPQARSRYATALATHLALEQGDSRSISTPPPRIATKGAAALRRPCRAVSRHTATAGAFASSGSGPRGSLSAAGPG